MLTTVYFSCYYVQQIGMTNVKIAKSFVFQVGRQMTQEYISITPRDREYWHLIPALHSLRACIFFSTQVSFI